MINFELFLAFMFAAWGRGNGIETAEDMAVAIVVQHEAGGLSSDLRAAVAEVIYNRVESGDHPGAVYDVIFAPGQFTGIESWITCRKWLPTRETAMAVRRARDEDVHDCLYFYNPAYSSEAARRWFECSGDVEYVFSLTEESQGICYETRFFR